LRTAATRYAKTPDGLHVAYSVLGDGPFDLVFISDWRSHVEVITEEPSAARFFERLASFSRLIWFDKRGTGLSDPVALAALPSLEDWMDDVRVVLDAVGSERAALLGSTGGGPMAILFAATHPDRTQALVLANTFARLTQADDYLSGIPAHVRDRLLPGLAEHWGTGAILTLTSPLAASDEHLRTWWGRFERLAASPGAAFAMQRAVFELDVRSVLPTLAVPTLVVHRRDLRFIRVEHGRYLAEHIPGATYVELPGGEQLFFVGSDDLLDEIESFLTGHRRGSEPDRVLATVLFTDIVGSTEHAVQVGDRRWRDVLDRYDAMADRQLERFRGRLIKTTGDGTLATFDGPARAVRCAFAIREAVRRLGLEVRCGLHTGEIEARGGDIGGLAVHIGQRISAGARSGEVLVSRTVVDLVAGSGIEFEDRGDHELKGVPGKWQLSAVKSA